MEMMPQFAVRCLLKKLFELKSCKIKTNEVCRTFEEFARSKEKRQIFKQAAIKEMLAYRY